MGLRGKKFSPDAVVSRKRFAPRAETDLNTKSGSIFLRGPLDLLLYLIKKDEVDIHNISIERITKQYLDYIDTFKMLNIDLASEFIVMAANLMYIKSRTLLPKAEQPPEEDIEGGRPTLGAYPAANRV